MMFKVFAGMTHINGEQVHCCVATSSRKKAAELVGTTLNHVVGYWSVTGNKRDCAIALSEPETVFYFKRGEEYKDTAQPLKWTRDSAE